MNFIILDDRCGKDVAKVLCLLGEKVVAVQSLADLDVALRVVHPDAIAVDLGLWCEEPSQVVAHVRLRYNGRVVVASGSDYATEIAAANGCPCVLKPYTPEQLLAALKGQ